MSRYTDPADRALAKAHAVSTRALPVDEGAVEVYLRRQAIVGHLGAQMGLDFLAGIVWCNVKDHGGSHRYQLPPGTVVVELWHDCKGDDLVEAARDADAMIEDHRPAAVLVIPIHGVARWHHYLRRWWRQLGRARR